MKARGFTASSCHGQPQSSMVDDGEVQTSQRSHQDHFHVIGIFWLHENIYNIDVFSLLPSCSGSFPLISQILIDGESYDHALM